MRILPHNPYYYAFNTNRGEHAQKVTTSNFNLANQGGQPAQNTSKPVRFGGAWTDLVKAAAYGTSYGWCALKGVAGGLSLYPADAVFLGGAPVTSVATGAAVLGDCIQESTKALKEVFA